MTYKNGYFIGGFITVPAKVLIDKNLNYFEKIVFGEMFVMDNINELDTDINFKISEKYDEPLIKVNRAIKKIKKYGYFI